MKPSPASDASSATGSAATWRRLPLESIDPQAVAVDPRSADSVWISANVFLYHSTDGGLTWQTVDAPFLVVNGATTLRFDAAGRLHVAYPDHGVWELTE